VQPQLGQRVALRRDAWFSIRSLSAGHTLSWHR
jgi:hypothetical protein